MDSTQDYSVLAADCILDSNMPKPDEKRLKMYLVPCSCGTAFVVSENYDRQGTAWSRYLKCPSCGKRHDPKNRLLQLGYQRAGYWKVDGC
jgi:hydrogenase maturation factor HypF (carbamoyltransferase family)